MPNFCSAPMCQTGCYNNHSGISVFKMHHSPDIQDKWMRSFKLNKLNMKLNFDELVNKLSEVQVPGGSYILYLNSSCMNVLNLKSTHPITLKSYYTVDNSLRIICYNHGFPIILSIQLITDVRQISLLIDKFEIYRADSVDKTIRNNWLNQKDYNCTFTFPCFQDVYNSIYPVKQSKAALQVTKI